VVGEGVCFYTYPQVGSEIQRVGTSVDRADLGGCGSVVQQFKHGSIEADRGALFHRCGEGGFSGKGATESAKAGEATERDLLQTEHRFLVVRVAALGEAETEVRFRALGGEVQARGGVRRVAVHRTITFEKVDVVLQCRIQVNAAVEAFVNQRTDGLGAELDRVGVVASQPGKGLNQFLTFTSLVHGLQFAGQGIQDTHELELAGHARVRGHAVSDHTLQGTDMTLGFRIGALEPDLFQLFVGDDGQIAVALHLDIIETNVQEAFLEHVSGQDDFLVVEDSGLVAEEDGGECLGASIHRGVLAQKLVQGEGGHVLVRHTRDGGLGVAHGASGGSNHG